MPKYTFSSMIDYDRLVKSQHLKPEQTTKVCVWPDDGWCFEEDVHEYSWKSDDYVVVNVMNDLEEEEIDQFVYGYNKLMWMQS